MKLTWFAHQGKSCTILFYLVLYNNNYSSIIDIYFYETFSTSSQNLLALVLSSLDTLSDIRIKAFTLLF